MTNREQFEAWMTAEQWFHGSDFEWDERRNCYSQFGIHLAYKAWQAASKASEQQLAAVVAENAQMLRLLTDISENHDEYVNADEYLYAGVPMDYVSEINAYVSRDVDAENPFKATDAVLNEVRAQGVEMFAETQKKIADEELIGGNFDLSLHFRRMSNAVEEFAAQLRQGEKL